MSLCKTVFRYRLWFSCSFVSLKWLKTFQKSFLLKLPNSLLKVWCQPWKPNSMDQSCKQEQAAQDFSLFISFLNETSVCKKKKERSLGPELSDVETNTWPEIWPLRDLFLAQPLPLRSSSLCGLECISWIGKKMIRKKKKSIFIKLTLPSCKDGTVAALHTFFGFSRATLHFHWYREDLNLSSWLLHFSNWF